MVISIGSCGVSDKSNNLGEVGEREKIEDSVLWSSILNDTVIACVLINKEQKTIPITKIPNINFFFISFTQGYTSNIFFALLISLSSNDKFREYRTIYPEYDFKNQVSSFDIILGVLVTQLTDYQR